MAVALREIKEGGATCCSIAQLLAIRWLTQIALDNPTVLLNTTEQDGCFVQAIAERLESPESDVITQVFDSGGNWTILPPGKLEHLRRAAKLARCWYHRYHDLGWPPNQLAYLEDILARLLGKSVERKVFTLSYIQGYEDRNVAIKLHMTIERVCKILETITHKIEKVYLIGDDWHFTPKLIEIMEVKSLPADEIDTSRFCETDKQFRANHPNGCSPTALAINLGIPPRNMNGYVRRRTVLTEGDPRNRKVPPAEIDRVTEVCRFFVTAHTLVLAIGADSETFNRYSEQDRSFGPTKKHPSGALMLERNWLDRLPELRAKYEVISAEHLSASHWTPLHSELLEEGYVSRAVIMATLHVSRSITHRWFIQVLILPYEIRKHNQVVSLEHFVRFTRMVVTGEIKKVNKTVAENCRQFLKTREFVLPKANSPS